MSLGQFYHLGIFKPILHFVLHHFAFNYKLRKYTERMNLTIQVLLGRMTQTYKILCLCCGVRKLACFVFVVMHFPWKSISHCSMLVHSKSVATKLKGLLR